MISGPGMYEGVPMAEYLAFPALNASTIWTIVTRCPAAAYAESPYAPQPNADDANAAADAGTIAHAILLEGSEACVCEIDPNLYPAKTTGEIPKGWTNNAIRLARDNARAAGKIPVFPQAMGQIRAMAGAARAKILASPLAYALGPEGVSEAVLLWKEGDTLCKIRPDRLSPERDLCLDAKFTDGSANPSTWGRSQMHRMGFYLSAAWYRRGIQAVLKTDPEYVFAVTEMTNPYCSSLIGVDPGWLALAERQIGMALSQWHTCIRTGRWPAYPDQVCYPEMPSFLEPQWIEYEASTFSFELGAQA